MKFTLKLLSMLFLWSIQTLAFAQTGTIKGGIQSATGEPLVGISVGLQGTSLGAPTNENGTFAIQNIPAGTYTLTATGVGYVATRQNVTVTPGKTLRFDLQLSESQTELQEVVVKSRSESYLELNSDVALRSRTPLKDIPQSIQVVTRQVLVEQQAYTLSDALNNVAGVTPKGDWNYFNMRGFLTGAANIMVNGQRNGFINEDQSPTLPYVERIEVLRGPSSVLFGNGSIGGTLNMVTKKPQKDFNVGANLTVGSFGLARLQADVTGALNKSRTLSGLLNIGAETGGNFIRDFKNQNLVITPMFTWEISPAPAYIQ